MTAKIVYWVVNVISRKDAFFITVSGKIFSGYFSVILRAKFFKISIRNVSFRYPLYSQGLCRNQDWALCIQRRNFRVPKVTVSTAWLLDVLLRDLACFHYWFSLTSSFIRLVPPYPLFVWWPDKFCSFFFFLTTQLFFVFCPFFMEPMFSITIKMKQNSLNSALLFHRTSLFFLNLNISSFILPPLELFFLTLPISISCLISCIYYMWMQWVYKNFTNK